MKLMSAFCDHETNTKSFNELPINRKIQQDSEQAASTTSAQEMVGIYIL